MHVHCWHILDFFSKITHEWNIIHQARLPGKPTDVTKTDLSSKQIYLYEVLTQVKFWNGIHISPSFLPQSASLPLGSKDSWHWLIYVPFTASQMANNKFCQESPLVQLWGAIGSIRVLGCCSLETCFRRSDGFTFCIDPCYLHIVLHCHLGIDPAWWSCQSTLVNKWRP